MAEVVRIVVDHDEQLAAIDGYDGDFYEWTRDYGHYGTVDLIMPPGQAADWAINWTPMIDGGLFAVVDMWTRQEGRSDLSLELQLHRGPALKWIPTVLGLHVL